MQSEASLLCSAMGYGLLDSERHPRYPRYSANRDSKNSGVISYLMHSRVLSSLSGGATSDEEAAVVNNAYSGAPTIFDKIISKEIPSIIVYEDEGVLAFRDINPQAPVHVLVIPKSRDGLTELGKVHGLISCRVRVPGSSTRNTKVHDTKVHDTTRLPGLAAENTHQEILGRLLYAAKIVAEKEGIADGFRVVINSGTSACQAVFHLHLHVLGGRQMEWPPG
ncbi:hypothetical protein OROHE_017852 [Orobanche hederae]